MEYRIRSRTVSGFLMEAAGFKWTACAPPPRLFWRRRAKQRGGKRNRARRGIGGRAAHVRPLAPNTKRVVTGGSGGGTQKRKPPPRKPGAPQQLCKPLCGAPPKGAGRAGLRYVGNGPEEGWGERERGKGTIGALPPFATPRSFGEGTAAGKTEKDHKISSHTSYPGIVYCIR